MGLFDKLMKAADKAADAANDAISKAGKSDAWAKITDVAGQFADVATETAQEVQKSGTWAKITSAAKDAGESIKRAVAETSAESQYWGRPKGGQGTFWAEVTIPDGLPKDHGRDDYFVELIHANLPELTVCQWVPINQIDPSSELHAASVNILLLRGMVPVLAILLVERNKYKTQAIVGMMDSCTRMNIPVMRFMREFENRPEYVIGRIKSVL